MSTDPITLTIVQGMLSSLAAWLITDEDVRKGWRSKTTGQGVVERQLEAAWKAGRKAFAQVVEGDYPDYEGIGARLDELFLSEPFPEALSALPMGVDDETVQHCRQFFCEYVRDDADTFDHAWSNLVRSFHRSSLKSEELSRLIAIQNAERQKNLAQRIREGVDRSNETLVEVLALLRAGRDVAGEESAKPLSSAMTAYLREVQKEAGRLWLDGLDRELQQDAKANLQLDSVYTALYAGHQADLESLARRDKEPLDGEWAEHAAMTERLHRGVGDHVPALEQLRRRQRLVILGDPGSGKSTFVNFIALCMAGEWLGEGVGLETLCQPLPNKDGKDQKKPQAWEHGPLIPVRIVLRDFASSKSFGEDEKSAIERLWGFLERQWTKTKCDKALSELDQALEEGRVMVLFDGLDEVDEAGEGETVSARERLVKTLDAFADRYSKCRYLVTCRTYAYRDRRWQLKDFHAAILQDWQRGQIRRFIDRWYDHAAHLGRYEREVATSRAGDLKQAIETTPNLLRMAEKPLLLTLMASLHAWRGGRLPDGRAELYEQAVDLLLDQWERGKGVGPDGKTIPLQSVAEFLKVDRSAILGALERLAFEAHRTQRTGRGQPADIARKDLLDALYEISSRAISVDQMVRFLRDRAGLLIDRGGKIYSFVHRSFQEYLAARHLLKESSYPTRLAELARSDPDRWREVAALAAAIPAKTVPSNVWSLVRALLPRRSQRPSLASARAAQLAGLVLRESGLVPNEAEWRPKDPKDRKLLDRLRHWMLDNLTGERLEASGRAECGRHLARFGEVREEVLTVEAMEWCFVPPGKVLMGSTRSWDNQKPEHESSVPYGYWLSRFPVTNAQFRAFATVGGYTKGEFWPEAVAHKRWNGGFKLGENFIEGPPDVREPFSLANHPVVGLTWYEARAFCRWLAEHLRSVALLPKGWVVDLPNEPEWEKGARGGDVEPLNPVSRNLASIIDGPEPILAARELSDLPTRRYPWGDEADLDRMNVDDTEINASNAVGGFRRGRTVYGLEEMSGNVLEWTRSVYARYPYPQGGESLSEIEKFANPNAPLVLRGGGFALNPNLAQCSNRYRNRARVRGSFFGFRPVLRPSVHL